MSFVSILYFLLDGWLPNEVDLVLHAHKRTKLWHELKLNISESSEVATLIVGEQHVGLDVALKKKQKQNTDEDERHENKSVCNRLRDPL